MIILLFFAFISGLVTILAPCIWPLLPIILSSSLNGGKAKSLGITLGIMVSFSVFILSISYLVQLFGLDPNVIRLLAVIVLVIMGLSMIVPTLSRILEGMLSRLSGRFGQSQNRSGFGGGFLTGCSLGVVWTPCTGPILATIATLAATTSLNLGIILVTIVYVMGLGIPLFFFSYGGGKLIAKTRFVGGFTGRIQQVFGVVLLLTALAIYTNYDKVLQVKLLDAFPSYTSFLIGLESNSAVKTQLDILKGKKENKALEMVGKPFNMTDSNSLPNLGRAPEFVGITHWLNTDKPLTMTGLAGKVVLIDIWTYTCINCIRTLPYVTSWYEKYKDKGFVVVGVHSPEFEFEKKTENVQNAIKQYNITYPVAQDNNFTTWNAYSNQYWPAKYLIDKDGNIRYSHFGEGKYEETEQAIQELLKEAGAKEISSKVNNPTYQNYAKTPETYLGSKRSTDESILKGDWDIKEEFAQAGKKSSIEIPFNASKVFLVIVPNPVNLTVYPGDTLWGFAQRYFNSGFDWKKLQEVNPGVVPEKIEVGSTILVPFEGSHFLKSVEKIPIYLDGKKVGNDSVGSDVKDGNVLLDTDRLYNLIDLKESYGQHLLRLEVPQGIKVFAFTFG